MKTFEIGYGNTYPHYYTLKGNNGIGNVTGAYLNDNPIEVGDILEINKIPHTIVELETSKPKSKRHHKPATAFSCVTSYDVQLASNTLTR